MAVMVHYYQGDNPNEVLDIVPAALNLDDYTRVEHNLFIDPKPTSLAGIGRSGATLSMVEDFVRLTCTGTFTHPTTMLPRMQIITTAKAARVTPGAPYYLAAEARHSRGLPVAIRPWWLNADGVYIGAAPVQTYVASDTEWALVSHTGTVPPDAHYMGCEVGVDARTEPSAEGDLIDVRRFRTEPGEYADGDTDGWTWDGVPNASPSTSSTLPALATATLESPDGLNLPLTAQVTTSVGGTGVVAVTMTGPFETTGMHRLVVTITGDEQTRTLTPLRVPVEALDGDGWYTLDAARREWPGATEDDARLYDLLAVARTQVLAYAPDVLGPVPENYRAAQLMQARNIWNAYQTDPNANTYGPDGFSVPVYPLDWSVKQMLRPKRAVPVVA